MGFCSFCLQIMFGYHLLDSSDRVIPNLRCPTLAKVRAALLLNENLQLVTFLDKSAGDPCSTPFRCRLLEPCFSGTWGPLGVVVLVLGWHLKKD